MSSPQAPPTDPHHTDPHHTGPPSWHWQTATGADEVHTLLTSCDAHQAAISGTPAPRRRQETTRRLVESGSVHLLRHTTGPAGMFTLTRRPPSGTDEEVFPPAERPLYLSRLAVAPAWLTAPALVGLRCVRRAVEVAAGMGGDVLRAQVNPDLRDTCALLGLLDFTPCGPTFDDGSGRRHAHLHRLLDPVAAGAGKD
ncbi:hypothetical protein [Streptomyces milbemycinicus]|uniref:GNAT family N-acetyltransferase n=1 Tax=Streptomyces milbemycinicus TaxID=476552 RepID=A0ABW8LZR6_9ACTN